MPKFLVTIHRPHDYDPSQEGPEMAQEIDALNAEMVAAGIRVFVGGLHAISEARCIRGDAEVQSGPYLGGTEHVSGLWVLELPDLEEAIRWGRKASHACRAPVEVRAFH